MIQQGWGFVGQGQGQSDDRPEAGPSRAFSNPQLLLAHVTSSISYEQTKRHVRIFFLDDLYNSPHQQTQENSIVVIVDINFIEKL